MGEKEFIRLYKQKNDDIKAPEELVHSTLEKMLQENQRLQAAAPARTGKKTAGSYWRYIAAAAACMVLLVLAVARPGSTNVPMTEFLGPSLTMEREEPPALQPGLQSEIWDVARYGAYIGRDLTGFVEGFVCQDSMIRIWRDEAGNIVNDHARLYYRQKEKTVTLLISACAPVGPKALADGESVELNGRRMRFGLATESGVYYALWEEGPVCYCLQSGDLSRRGFVRLAEGAG